MLAKCKRYFPPAKKVGKKIVRAFTFDIFLLEWKSLINSTNEAIFWQTYADFKRKYPQEVVKYVNITWIGPWKEKFVACWVDQHRHLGHTTIFMVKGLHVIIKQFLWSLTGNLATVF